MHNVGDAYSSFQFNTCNICIGTNTEMRIFQKEVIIFANMVKVKYQIGLKKCRLKILRSPLSFKTVSSGGKHFLPWSIIIILYCTVQVLQESSVVDRVNHIIEYSQ